MMKSGIFLATLLFSCLLARTTVAAPQDSAPNASTESELKLATALTAKQDADAKHGIIGGLLNKATDLIGTPYRLGGTTPDSGFDCSGFVGYLFKTNLNLNLPRTSKDMSQVGDKIDKDELKPGDLLFFKTVKRSISHVGIYVGDGKFIHSPWHGSSVEVAYLGMKYWSKRFAVAKRVDLPAALTNPLGSPLQSAAPQQQ